MESRVKKIILIFMALTVLVAAGLFLASEKSISFVSFGLTMEKKTTAEVKPKGPVRILFVGDMMFDRYIRQVSGKRGQSFPMQKVEALLKGNDLVVGNLEGPITDQQSVSVNSVIGERNNYIFTFDSRTSDFLASENIRLVNIGNNHISNFGSEGIATTRKYLSESGVKYFGDPEDENSRVAIEDINGMKIAFVNYNQFVADGKQKALADINKAKDSKVDLTVLYTHWGTEFVAEPSQKIKDLAHEFVDAGADLIIGSHPHVVQSKENYKGKTIYYSLGNFIFDQYFSPETQKGLAVQVDINSDKNMQFQEYPIKMDNKGQTSQY